MRLRHQLARSVVLQGAGAVCTLAAVVLLGVALGPQQQGLFSRTKTEVEFVSALALFGMPQALFYFVKSGRLALPAALRLAMAVVLVGAAVGMAYAWLALGAAAALVLALGLATAASVWHGQLRALLLVGADTLWFNLATSAPQVLLLAGAVGVVLAGGVSEGALAAVFAAVFALASLLALWRVGLQPVAGRAPASSPASPPAEAVRWPDIARYGLATWVAAALATAAALWLQRRVESGLGTGALGLFTMAFTLAQVPLTPINYAVPLLFRHWMGGAAQRQARQTAALAGLGLLACAALAALLARLQPDLFLGARYAGVAGLLPLLLVAAGAEAVLRILCVQANALGRPWQPAVAEAVRCMALFAAWAVGPALSLGVACGTWALAAACAAAVLVVWPVRPEAAHS